MTLSPRTRYDHSADELALDRPGDDRPYAERTVEARPTVDARPALESRSTVEPAYVESRYPARVAEAPPVRRGFDPIGGLSSIVGLAAKLTMLLILLTILWALAGLVGVGGSVTGGVGARVSSAIGQAGSAASAIGQRAMDALDPTHPPRDALSQDLEIDELLRVNVGGDLAGSTTRTVTLSAVQRRADAPNADASLYATLHSELRQSNDTKVMGVTIRSTKEPRDDYIYKGETVRVGTKLYKVNWISAERKQIALVLYRDQDHVTAPVKASFD